MEVIKYCFSEREGTFEKTKGLYIVVKNAIIGWFTPRTHTYICITTYLCKLPFLFWCVVIFSYHFYLLWNHLGCAQLQVSPVSYYFVCNFHKKLQLSRFLLFFNDLNLTFINNTSASWQNYIRVSWINISLGDNNES